MTVLVLDAEPFSLLARRQGAARLVGSVLATARSGSVDMVDAHAVAAAVDAGGGVVLTGDEGDLTRLGAAYPNVHIDSV